MNPDSEIVTSKAGEPLPRLLLGMWLGLTAIPFFAILSALLLFIPELVRGSMFADPAALMILSLMIASATIVTLVGFAKAWYFSWVVAKLSYQFAIFIIGLAIVIAIFNSPANVLGAMLLVGLFILLKLAFMCSNSLDTRKIRDCYSVVKYSHY